ncbi:MAG: cupredoxin domain-containing protein [Actinomycetes bacterium]
MRIAPAVLLAAVLALTGCASGNTGAAGPGGTDSGTPTATSPSPAGSPTDGSAKVDTITVAVKGGKVVPAPHRVAITKGDQVRLVVISDRADEVHVHGVDIEKPLAPGKPVTITFTADQPGIYDVETHQSGLQLLQLVVR